MPQPFKYLRVAGAVLVVLGVGVMARIRISGQGAYAVVHVPEVSAEGQNTEHRAVSPLFDPALAAQLLDDPGRDRWQHPDRIVNELKLRPGDAVADIGAGSGYLMQRLSRAVGPDGCVFAEEIQPDYLPMLHRRAKALQNVRVVLGNAVEPRLPSRSVDCFVLLTVYHEVQHPIEFLSTLHRSARPGARLAIIDFDAKRHGMPPAPDGHEIAEAIVVEEARKAGWEVCERHDFLSSQFYLVFRQAR